MDIDPVTIYESAKRASSDLQEFVEGIRNYSRNRHYSFHPSFFESLAKSRIVFRFPECENKTLLKKLLIIIDF